MYVISASATPRGARCVAVRRHPVNGSANGARTGAQPADWEPTHTREPFAANRLAAFLDACKLASEMMQRFAAELNLARVDLRFADLSRADLRSADLSGADLRGAVVAGAQIDGAKLEGTRLDPEVERMMQAASRSRRRCRFPPASISSRCCPPTPPAAKPCRAVRSRWSSGRPGASRSG